MHLILHTLRKDTRRLWPAVAVTCLMLVEFAREDRWRSDALPSPLEGWLNLLLTMAWAMLAALAVLEEPLVGARNFWTTRPHRWPALLASKLLFALLAIHLPLLLADLYILTARGLSPAGAVGPILWKQFLFFGALTLPSIALASLVRNFTHFVIAVFAIAAGIAILNGGFQRFPEFPRREIDLSHVAIRALVAAASLAVIWTQYARRRVIPARVTAIAAMLLAASFSAWLPVRASYAVAGGGSREIPQISLRSSPPAASPEALSRFGGAQTVALLPIAIAAGAPAAHFRISFVEVEIVAADGARLQSALPSPNRPFERIDLTAYAFSAPPEQAQARFLAAGVLPSSGLAGPALLGPGLGAHQKCSRAHSRNGRLRFLSPGRDRRITPGRQRVHSSHGAVHRHDGGRSLCRTNVEGLLRVAARTSLGLNRFATRAVGP